MNRITRVANPPPKPLLVYDGDCRFCGLWIKRWRQIAGERVDFLPFQDAIIAARFPELPQSQFETAVQLIEPSGDVHSGARAAFGAIGNHPFWGQGLNGYEKFPWFASLTEGGYRVVARHRTWFSWLTRMAWGSHVEQPTYFLTRWIFLRGLALVYLFAFLSLGSQIIGLVGQNGIEPAGEFLKQVDKVLDARGLSFAKFHQLPTLCWFDSSDGFLRFLCGAGVALSLLLLVGFAPAPCLFLLWLIYLSLSCVGGAFLGFQWDALLLEAGLLAILFAPRSMLPGIARETPPSRIMIWLLRWLVFRLMFQSGLTKLLYDDPAWSGWTALTFHYETQPLPTWIGWYAHQLPLWFHKFSCGLMYAIEIVLPFLFFAPRRLRMFAGGANILLQVAIALTGNYTFFNLLTIVLCVPLFDDFALRKFASATKQAVLDARAVMPSPPRRVWRTWGIGSFAAFVVFVTAAEMFRNLRWTDSTPAFIAQLRPFRSLNDYGLFRVMTHPRREIVIEGSDDGITWRAYEFRYKPGNPQQRPKFVAPHQPRLDWQMWFAALSEARHNPWLVRCCVRLLHGAPEVLALFEHNPFPEHPPKYIRAMSYDYRFSTRAERQTSGNWWERTELGLYMRPIALQQSAEAQ